MKTQGPIKICLAASAGGHLCQILKLTEGLRDYRVVCITTNKMVQETLCKFGRVYVVGECNRQHPYRVLKVLLRCIRAVFKERPDVLISTGAAAGCIACYLGKMLGAKVIWVDSITNVKHLSLSGMMVRYIADMFLVQWPELVNQYKDVEYAGTLI